MKNRIIDFRYSVVALLLIFLNGVGAFASTPWTVNPGDYRYDMSIYLDVLDLNSVKLDYSNYEVAVFCDEECRGVAERLLLGDNNECLYLRVRSNQEKGEAMTIKFYNKATEEVLTIDGFSFEFESNGRLGYPSAPFIVKMGRYYDVILSAGPGGSIDQQSGLFAESTELTITATPAEGYHFEKWSDGVTDNPRTVVVDGDIKLAAEFGVNSYKLIYMVDGEEYKVYTVAYGTKIIPESPVKDGHTFGGWESLPETMPAHDVTVTGAFSINSYNAIFKISDEVIGTVSVVYGQPIVAPVAPEKLGYTFAGWQDVPETMPARDIEIFGSYTANSYKLIYKVDGEVYKVYTIAYGAEVIPEEYPEKEGYIFSGWGVAPMNMTAHDFIVRGRFIINSYTLRIYLNGELHHSEIVEYGSPVSVKESIVPAGMKFDGFINKIPEKMPAHDVDIYATYSGETSIASIKLDDDTNVTIGTLNGYILYRNEIWENVKDKLEKGIYIINGVKFFIK